MEMTVFNSLKHKLAKMWASCNGRAEVLVYSGRAISHFVAFFRYFSTKTPPDFSGGGVI
jgi:hypothetical protein